MKMTVLGHLEELRWGIIRCIIYIVLMSCIALFFADRILEIIKYPSKNLIDGFLILKPAESITIYMKTVIFSGIIAAAPAIMREFFHFIKPAAGAKQSLSVSLYVLTAFSLFIMGAVFVYFIVLPKAISFLMSLSVGLTGTLAQITLTSYVSFVFALLLCGGLIFQIPLAAFILTKIGLLTPQFLTSRRKEAYFILVVFAAVITPTTDAFSMIMFVIPMILLYEIGIVFSKAVYKSQLKKIGEDYVNQNQ
ncbi:MAG: twin-arginine translocase subunit TatC [Elusimicrobiota bacterium]|jgi:sec-independent protein translocase protein TatC|nr:twin-arginine translocase subunit TatC [Elusimicrobiota bacterium]